MGFSRNPRCSMFFMDFIDMLMMLRPLFGPLFFSENEWHFGHERRSVPFATTASLRVR